jgi:hypothetical protein
LTDEDFEGIKQRLADLDVAEREIERASQAGIDVSEQRKTAKAQRAQLLKLKQVYFPARI